MKSFFTFILFLTVLSATAQKDVIVKYYDSLWHISSEEDAKYVGHFKKVDTLYEFVFYYLPSFKIYSRGSSRLTGFKNPIGSRVRYFLDGKIKDTAFFYKPNIASFMKSYYANGRIIDSLVNGDKILDYRKFFFSPTGGCDSLEYFDNEPKKWILEEFDALGKSISKRLKYKETIQIIAEFPGGKAAWVEYLKNNLDVGTPQRNGAPPGKYVVMIGFKIKPDGAVDEVFAENDPGYGCKEEAIRVVQHCPKWNPASVDGKFVTFRVKQAITFMVSSN